MLVRDMVFLDWDYLVLVQDFIMYPGRIASWTPQEDMMRIIVEFKTGGTQVFNFDNVNEFNRFKGLVYGSGGG